MRAYFLIFALALLKVNLAYPQNYNNDFSIDMYEGNNHLRYQRSNEAEESHHGTSLTIENVDAEHAIDFHHKTEETITPEEAIKLAQAAMDQAAAKASEGQKTEVDIKNMHLHQAETVASVAVPAATESDTVVKKESDKVVKVEETHKAIETVKETATAAAAASATTKETKEDASTGISHSTSKTEISMSGSRANSNPKEEVKELQAKPQYLFKYGEVLNLINQDRVNPLSSKKSNKGKSKKLSKTNGQQGSSTGFSYVMVNGKEYAGPSTGAIAVTKPGKQQQNQNNNNQNNFAPSNGFMGVPTPYGQQFGAPAHAAFKPGFNPMNEGTQSLKSNARMGGFHGYQGYQGFAPPMPTNSGIRMLGFNRPPVPFPAAGFRPF